jgi:NADH dehydrogenase
MSNNLDVVTGAFGYIGRYIADQLLENGRKVKTITTHRNKPNPFGPAVQAFPYHFDDPERLEATLVGADTLYNTYWIRFEHSGMTFEQAIANTRTLFHCAARAGVRKIVHISVTQASTESPLPYYAGKARQEEALKETGLPYAIVRPTLVFGKEEILANNIAWLLRKFPVFPIAGDGRYWLQPIYVKDLASIAVAQAQDMRSETIDAIGPERYTFQGFVQTIASAIGSNAIIVHLPPWATILLGKMLGLFLKDVILSRDELRGLMDNTLTSEQPPNAWTKFSEWLEENHQTMGRDYSSELDRHFRGSFRK